jgi:hypothetical protein
MISKKRQKELIIDALMMCDSYDRFPTFLEITDEMDLEGELYWFALKECYSTCDNNYQFRHMIKDAFRRKDSHREILMSKEERKYLKKLPDTLTIYRGMTVEEYESGNFGVSWTLKESVAKFFAEMYMRNFDTKHLPKTIHQLTIKKEDVIAYFGERKEFEIIYLNK